MKSFFFLFFSILFTFPLCSVWATKPTNIPMGDLVNSSNNIPTAPTTTNTGDGSSANPEQPTSKESSSGSRGASKEAYQPHSVSGAPLGTFNLMQEYDKEEGSKNPNYYIDPEEGPQKVVAPVPTNFPQEEQGDLSYWNRKKNSSSKNQKQSEQNPLQNIKVYEAPDF